MPTSRRRQRLIQPRLQLRLVSSFVGLSVLALALQFILLAAMLTNIASELPQDGPFLMQELPSMLWWVLLLSVGLCLPLTFCVGVIVTFRIAGPLHRIQKHLEALARGEDPGECTLRKDDELKDLARALNEATRALRQPASSKLEGGEGPRRLSEAA
ncbi:MAG: HAMP domain-containing protein [Planctomycetes bacterium]|nr:HAMP domain-containing protein [Planctomycetota bacterium]